MGEALCRVNLVQYPCRIFQCTHDLLFQLFFDDHHAHVLLFELEPKQETALGIKLDNPFFLSLLNHKAVAFNTAFVTGRCAKDGVLPEKGFLQQSSGKFRFFDFTWPQHRLARTRCHGEDQ